MSVGALAFHQCTNITKAALSAELKQLRLVDRNAFFQQQWGSNRYVEDSTLREVVLGGAFGFTIRTNAFNGQKALFSVSFTGAKPVYDIDEGGEVFGASNPARSMAFYVPDSAEWADVIVQATPASAVERETWLAAHPDSLPIWGVVPASVFHTRNEQYIGYYAKRVRAPELFFDARLGDGATFESLGPYPAASDGSWPTNNSFRISATVGAGGTFVRWYGDMPKDLCGQRVVEVAGDRLADMQWLLPRITHPWTFDTAKKTLSNGIWSLHASYASASRLRLGNSDIGSWEEAGRALTGTGSGYLDLGGPVSTPAGDSFTIDGLIGGDFLLGSAEGKPGPTVLVTPGTMSGPLLNYKHFSSVKREISCLKVLVVDEPDVTDGFSKGWLLRNTQVERLQLVVPNLRSISDDAFDMWSVFRLGLNFSLCDFSRVRRLGKSAFYFCRDARGVADFPSLVSLGDSAFYGCECLQAACLATNRNEAVSQIAASAFGRCASLERIVLNQARDAAIFPAFSTCSALREVRFLGVPPTRAILSSILAAVAETKGAKPCVVYGSRAQETSGLSWTALASEPTEEERAAFPGDAASLCGVFRKDPGGIPDLGNAWIVDSPSPWDPKGLILLFR